MTFRLGVVGHAAEKFTAQTELAARLAIRDLIERHGATSIVSGHSPMGGVDIWAEQIGNVCGLELDIKAPRQHRWDGEYGFRARNLDIARCSDLVAVVVVRELPAGFTGRHFPYCYHCKDRNPPHVKSGGCWTAWKALRREWVIL